MRMHNHVGADQCVCPDEKENSNEYRANTQVRPYENDLPEGWVWKKVGEVCNILSGYGFPKNLQGKTSGDLPFYKVGDISQAWLSGNRYLVKANNYLSVEEAKKIKAKPLPAGTTVMAKIGEAIKLNRRVLLAKPSLVDNNVMGIYPKPDYVDSRYNFYYLLTISLGNYSQATTVPSVRKSDVSEIPIPLAPLEQQKLIVAEIEKQFSRLDEAVAALKRIQTNLKRYKASVLKAAIEGKLTEQWRKEHPDVEPASELLKRILAERKKKWEEKNPGKKYKEPIPPNISNLPSLPRGWAWASFDQVSSRVTVGHVGPMKEEYVDSGIPFLRSQNVRENKFESEGLKFISSEFHKKLQKSALQPSDLVVVRSGGVGVACVIPETLKEANCADLVIVKQPHSILPHFGAYYMNSIIKTRVASRRVGIALTHFNTQSLASMPIPVPPFAEQKKIAEEVESCLSIAEEIGVTIEANLKRAERLRQSILKKAFSGDLTERGLSNKEGL